MTPSLLSRNGLTGVGSRPTLRLLVDMLARVETFVHPGQGAVLARASLTGFFFRPFHLPDSPCGIYQDAAGEPVHLEAGDCQTRNVGAEGQSVSRGVETSTDIVWPTVEQGTVATTGQVKRSDNRAVYLSEAHEHHRSALPSLASLLPSVISNTRPRAGLEQV